MRLEEFKPQRVLANGKKSTPVPRCQHVEDGRQCSGAVYSSGKCFAHYVAPAPKGERVFLPL